MNRTYDYDALENEYVRGRMSVRELCRSHGISNSSTVNVQAKKRGWADKRELFQKRTSALTIERSAERVAERQAKEIAVRDEIVDTIHEAVQKMRVDMRATKKVQQGDVWVEEPVMRIGPNDLVKLIDRLQVLFGRPSSITEERNLGINLSADGLPPGSLAELLRATAGVQPVTVGGSALPRLEDDGPE